MNPARKKSPIYLRVVEYFVALGRSSPDALPLPNESTSGSALADCSDHAIAARLTNAAQVQSKRSYAYHVVTHFGENSCFGAICTCRSDLDAMIAGYRTVYDVVGQGPITKHIAGPWDPASRNPTTDDILSTIARLGQTTYHPVATCSMGPAHRTLPVTRREVRRAASLTPSIERANTERAENACRIPALTPGEHQVLAERVRGRVLTPLDLATGPDCKRVGRYG